MHFEIVESKLQAISFKSVQISGPSLICQPLRFLSSVTVLNTMKPKYLFLHAYLGIGPSSACCIGNEIGYLYGN